MDCNSFTSDLSNWDVSRLTDAASMFYEADLFDQNLCSWGARLPENVEVTDMFSLTNCSELDDPSTDDITRGPFCAICEDQ
jgi:surface protein